MRLRTALIFFILFLVSSSLSFSHEVHGELITEYIIQVFTDGSSSWIIKQIGTNVQVSLDAFSEFQEKVNSLVGDAEIQTGRKMSVDFEKFTTDVTGSYIAVSYYFKWENFSQAEESKIVIGDVFEVEGFFIRLQGDGKIYLTYPREYFVEAVSPKPSEQDSTLQTLTWYGTLDFTKGEPQIVLKGKSATPNISEFITQNTILIISIIALIIGLSTGTYFFRKKRKKEPQITKQPKYFTSGIEDDEEKIIRILKSSGGSLYQADLADQCGFSRAKTSNLLKNMEDKGKITRKDKGTKKIVILPEQKKDE